METPLESAPAAPGEASAPAAAFEALLAGVLPRAYGAACALTGDRADAEDLLQEAALLAFRAFASFAPGSDFKAWFYKILTNRHYERFRRSSRRPATVAFEEASDLYLYRRTAEAGLHALADDPARLVMSKLTTEEVMAAIADLPDEFRAVATLHFVEDMSYQEMAEVLGCPAGTVRSRLHRGRKLLQQRLWTLARESGIIGELTARTATA